MPDQLARVKRATRKRATADQEWRAAIRDAVAAGQSLRTVAAAAGVTNPRVHQIVNHR
jgi:hypothetical protein